MNCTEDPVDVLGEAKGEYDWDIELRNKSYTVEIKYSCPVKGWGYPSNGMSEVINVCQADKKWSLIEVEECTCKLAVTFMFKKFDLVLVTVLPCPKQPPPKPDGGWFWYGLEKSRYKCPNGFMFATGQYPYWNSSCTPSKIWDPPEVAKCIRKSDNQKILEQLTPSMPTARQCLNEPPDIFIDMDRDWPLSNRDMGSEIIYTCPYRMGTFIHKLKGK